jgi:pSer/pThr/pTyr-binding forkhead associated (FHA) protein
MFASCFSLPLSQEMTNLYSDLACPKSSDITTHTLDLEGSLVPESVEEYSDYNPAFEWPGEDESDSSFKSGSSYPVPIKGQPILRLVVLQSSILPSKRKVAVLDSYHEAQLGRDVQATSSATPRIRLKEMEVSKLHATVYWDGSRKEWNAVDMGSKHGTFLQSGTASPNSQAIKSRLSPPKFSSIPRRLRHGDRLSIGSTTFAVHIHENQRPCQDCTVSRVLEIPLFPAALQRTMNAEREPEGAGLQMPRDPKRRMTMLKRSLLKLHDEPKDPTTNSDNKANYYVDRSARRRLLHISSYSESPGVPSSAAITVQRDTRSLSGCPTPEPSSQPAIPINSSNIGHRLLVQQGWTPGTALGNPEGLRDGLVEPLEVRLKQNRAGLGSKH